jgi:large subunit ribosomal protein L19
MSNFIIHNQKKYQVGDTISFTYTLKEGDKERKQLFRGILMKVKGSSPATKMITVRKISHSGIGVEKIIPLASPFLSNLKLVKKGHVRRAKINFIRNLSNQQLTQKLYQKK